MFKLLICHVKSFNLCFNYKLQNYKIILIYSLIKADLAFGFLPLFGLASMGTFL